MYLRCALSLLFAISLFGQAQKPDVAPSPQPPAPPPIQVQVNEVIVPVTNGALDFGPWQRVFYGEWDGQRPKRVIIKAMGD